jgi:hypothetical protein
LFEECSKNCFLFLLVFGHQVALCDRDRVTLFAYVLGHRGLRDGVSSEAQKR